MNQTKDPHEHTLGDGMVWRSATRQMFGGAPVRIGDRALLRPADVEDPELHAPTLVVCVDIATDEDAPIWREMHMNPRRERVYIPEEARFVESIKQLVPGTWTRLPW